MSGNWIYGGPLCAAAAINQEGGMYGTALSCAVGERRLEMVEFLISKGATVNMPLPGSYGSALNHAVYANQLDIAEMLIDHVGSSGAPLRLQPGVVECRLSSTWSARERQSIGVCRDFLEAPLAAAASGRKLEVARLLIELGATVDLPLEAGSLGSALAAAAAGADVQILKYFVNKGCQCQPGLCHWPT
ncbi:ankyrin repeat domain-containing protein [Aspergillus saccharolyticus JOP 1030-1]|uniref:Ankyrin n=1 Tax=Aspergillus saccharolyticus JOP 1030-1 TaxID=1450539 RepID=A0A318ZI37_9EURO|nr:hypothetical protein BP01DRAFT_422010 [Aspergillus saccharolyticus JOP 1030-1]PYH47159.1 hypothetical protein BP01DRAFT_422010 [Aspergillus saccharolyticus JOP 1030-1]